MEEISIVRKRSRLWPLLLTILVLAALVLAVIWFMSDRPAADIGWNGIIELGGRYASGTA